ncbi:putative FCP1 domain, HAD superfamily protein [Dioscorea sansibarensis]
MDRILRSRLLFPYLSSIAGGNKMTRSFCSATVSARPPYEPLLNNQTPPPPPSSSPPTAPPPSSSPPAAPGSRSWSLFKFGAIAALTGAVGVAGYATYAYSIDEVDQKMRVLQASSKNSMLDDASRFQKFQALTYSSALKVPAKCIEIYLDIRRAIKEQLQGFVEPSSEKLLPDLHPQEQHVFTLVLDLNETLVYSDWKRDRGWRTFKRPGVDAFLEHLAKFYEIVVYSDQLSMYVDPVIERLDQKGCIRYRLSRAATKYQDGKHFRDLSKLNRDPARILYVSGHALESSLQPENCVPCKPWKLESDDTALLDLIPFLEYVALHRPADIRTVLASYQGHDIPSEFIERSKEHQRRMQEQKQHGRFWRR